MLKRLDHYQALLTTKENACGVNFFEKCHVLVTFMPETIVDFHQMFGRSNRSNYRGEKNGAIMCDQDIDKASIVEYLTAKDMNKK